MLGKLFKNEVRATSRIFLPLFGVLMVFTLICKFSMRPSSFQIPQWISFTGYVLTIGAIFAVTFFVIIQRFHKNLLGDEGYLMFTLPVKSWHLITSKLLGAVLWSFVSTIVTILSVLILSLDGYTLHRFFTGFGRFLEEFQHFNGMNFWIFGLEMFIMILFATITFVLVVYASISIGHLFNKHRVMASFGAFLGITFVLQIINGAIGNILEHSAWVQELNHFVVIGGPARVIHSMCLISCAYMVIIGALLFLGANWILSHRLNLE